MTKKINENDDIIIISGNANIPLASKICKHLNIPLGRTKISKFSDGETQVKIKQTVRLKKIFIIQPTCFPGNDTLMELLLMTDACKRSSASYVTAVVPYFGYARQDKKDEPRVPIGAKLVGNLMKTSGVDKIITIDLHANQLQGFFDIPVDHLYARPILVEYIRQNIKGDLVVLAPDTGAVARAGSVAGYLGADLAFIYKKRPKANASKVMNVIGDVKDKIAIIYDDMADTAGTLTKAADALKKMGAIEIHACTVHPVLSGPAIKRIEKSPISTLIVSDTIPLSEKAQKCSKIKVASVSKLLANAIIRSHQGDPISDLYF